MNQQYPKLVVCSSASFYKTVVTLSYELEALGIDVVLPKNAQKMKEEGDQPSRPIGHAEKAMLIRTHFNKIAQCDAIIVTNYDKPDKQNYIGPNVLMEMGIAFFLKKPIYILNDCPSDSPLLDEILGLEPVFLKGDTSKLEELLS